MTEAAVSTEYPTPPNSGIEVKDERLRQLIAPDARLEQIASGFTWTEGPLWIGDATNGMLLFSDIPNNRVHRWTAADGLSVYLQPSGFTGAYTASAESGANGLLADPDGNLILCQHGDRRVARMAAPVTAPKSVFETIVATHEGKRFNSPNDAAWAKNGDLYFTDPPYGLPGGQFDETAKELPFQGVYRFSFRDSSLTLLTSELTRPNGIALTPENDFLIVANSDPKNPVWMKYPLRADGTLGPGVVFKDVSDRVPGPRHSLPDGMVMHSSGNLFASGPGGVTVFSPEGEELGLIRTGQTTSNCTLNEEESMLYVTADSLVLRLALTQL